MILVGNAVDRQLKMSRSGCRSLASPGIRTGSVNVAKVVGNSGRTQCGKGRVCKELCVSERAADRCRRAITRVDRNAVVDTIEIDAAGPSASVRSNSRWQLGRYYNLSRQVGLGRRHLVRHPVIKPPADAR